VTERSAGRRGFRRWFADRPIAAKLSIAFGSLVVVTLVVVAGSILASQRATNRIDLTDDLRAPTALASAKAQTDLLLMLNEVRGYLALGDPVIRDAYATARAGFESDLASLEAIARDAAASGHAADIASLTGHLADFRAAYATWAPLPDRLFAIRDDQLQREPALRILLGPTQSAITPILVATADLIDTQQGRAATPASVGLLADMAAYQSSFLSQIAGLRGYVTTGRPSFKFEYTSNQTINESAWGRLQDRRSTLDSAQQADLDKIATAREAFAPLPDQMFAAVEGEHAREDLYLYRTEVTPVTDRMLAILDQTTKDEEALLRSELKDGRDTLSSAAAQALVGGGGALVVAVLLAFAFRRSIAGPIRRLTGVVETIGGGDLEARASVESSDEIGVLARTFNAMTARLGETVSALRTTNQVQAEYIEQVGHVTDAAASVEADAFEATELDGVAAREDALGQLARTFVRMAREVRAREERLRAQVRELTIEIDEARQAKKVAEITGTDYFRDLRQRAGDLRRTVSGADRPESKPADEPDRGEP